MGFTLELDERKEEKSSRTHELLREREKEKRGSDKAGKRMSGSINGT